MHHFKWLYHKVSWNKSNYVHTGVFDYIIFNEWLKRSVTVPRVIFCPKTNPDFSLFMICNYNPDLDNHAQLSWVFLPAKGLSESSVPRVRRLPGYCLDACASGRSQNTLDWLCTSSASACTSGSSRRSWEMLAEGGTFWTNLAWLACVLRFSLSPCILLFFWQRMMKLSGELKRCRQCF